MREQDVFRPTAAIRATSSVSIIGTDDEVGETMIADRRLPLISATGSCRMGRHVGTGRRGAARPHAARARREQRDHRHARRGPRARRSAASCSAPSAPPASAARPRGGSSVTATSSSTLTERLVKAYATVPIGDPLDAATLMGPLINQRAVDGMRAALEQARAEQLARRVGSLQRQLFFFFLTVQHMLLLCTTYSSSPALI